MAELVDARDLKSLGRKAIPVRFWVRALNNDLKVKGFSRLPRRKKTMIGRRKKHSLVESSTKTTDKVIDLHAWKGAKLIHGIASVVEGPEVKFVDVYRDIKDLYDRADAENEAANKQGAKRQSQFLRQKTRKKSKVVLRHQTH